MRGAITVCKAKEAVLFETIVIYLQLYQVKVQLSK